MPITGHMAWMIMWWTVEIAVFALVCWLLYATFGGGRERRIKELPKDKKAA